MTQPATRLINLIMLLQRRPNQKAADLAAELGISVRSLHRYMDGLDEMGIPIYSERGPAGGFSLVRGYKLPPLVFTPEEAVSLSLGASLVQEMWSSLYSEAAASALARLNALLPEAQRQEAAWARRSLVASGMQRPNLERLAPLLETLRQAARENQKVRMAYLSPGRPDATSRTVDPHALAYRWGWWYVIGYCHRREGMRIFRLDRITELTRLDEIFVPEKDFDARAFFEGEMAADQGLTVRLRFQPEMAQVAHANPFNWTDKEDQPDGSVIVSMQVPDLTWAASLALAYGPGVVVLEPEAVRQEVCRWAQSIASQYS